MPFLAAIQVCAPSGVLDLLAANVDMNRKVAAANGGEMNVQSIDWASWSSTDVSHGELDWIVGSDVTYDRRDWPVLIKMITTLSTPQTRVRTLLPVSESDPLPSRPHVRTGRVSSNVGPPQCAAASRSPRRLRRFLFARLVTL